MFQVINSWFGTLLDAMHALASFEPFGLWSPLGDAITYLAVGFDIEADEYDANPYDEDSRFDFRLLPRSAFLTLPLINQRDVPVQHPNHTLCLAAHTCL